MNIDDIYFCLISWQIFIFLVSFLLSYFLYKYIRKLFNTQIHSCCLFSYIWNCSAYLKYFLILVFTSPLASSKSTLFIASYSFPGRLIRLNAQAISASKIVLAIPLDSSFFVNFLKNNYIFHYSHICMRYIMLPKFKLYYILFVLFWNTLRRYLFAALLYVVL